MAFAPGFITAAVLAFAYTVGEFGVVLMLGGNIPAPRYCHIWSACIVNSNCRLFTSAMRWTRSHDSRHAAADRCRKISYQGPLVEGLTRLDLPLAHRDIASTVIDTTVASHDPAFQITHVVHGSIAFELPCLHASRW